MFNTFSSNSNNSVRNHFIFENNSLIQSDYIIGSYIQKGFFNNLKKQPSNSFFSYEPSNSLSSLNKHQISFKNETDFYNVSLGEIYKKIVTHDNLVDVFFEIRKINNNDKHIALGFHTSFLRNIYSFLDKSIRNLFVEYKPNKLDLFLEECVSKKIISLEQIKKVDDPQIIPFIICDYFIYLNLKNRVFENFFNSFPIFNKFKINLYLSSSDDEKYLLFHYQKIVDFIISNKLNISSIGNIVYNKPNEDGFERFVRFLNILKNHIPEHKTKVLQDILSLPLHGTIGNLNSQSNKILSFLAHSEPDLLLYFINHHIKEETITNRPLASFIKKELPIEFIKKNQDHFMKVMPDLFFEFSWDNISTEKKSSEVYSLPFHKILFSINVFDYYNEEHIFQKYLEYLKIFFQKINLPIIINYHLKTSAFFNRNFIESANITLSFDGHNEKFSDYILILNKSFFQHYVIADIMSSSNPHLTTDKYVREVYLKLKTNDIKRVQKDDSSGRKKV